MATDGETAAARPPWNLELGLAGAPPGIVAVERLVEAEHIGEIETRVGRLANEEPEIDQREHYITDVRSRAHTPVIQHEASHHTKAVDCEVTTRLRQLAPSDVPPLGQARLRELEC